MKYLYSVKLRGTILHSDRAALQTTVAEYLANQPGFRLTEYALETWSDGEGSLRTFEGGKNRFTLQGGGNLLASSEAEAQAFVEAFATNFPDLVITFQSLTAWTSGAGLQRFNDDGSDYIEPDDITGTQTLETAKAERAEAVAKILVTVDDMVFDGDETAQTRMGRTIVALDEGETMPWVLADNSIVTVTREQLRQALRAAGLAQAALWVKPYTEG